MAFIFFRDPFSVNLLQAALAFVVELGGSTFRGTYLLALVGSQSVPYSYREVVPISESLFKEIPLYRPDTRSQVHII